MKTSRHSFFIMMIGLLLSQGLLASEFRVVVRAHKGIESAREQWQPTIDVLSLKIPEHSFKLVPMLNLDEITLAGGRGDYEFVLTNPSSYVELHILHGARALVTLNNRRANTAQSRFGAVIFTHAKNEHILKLKDLKGTRVMGVSEEAFGGWRVAWLEMLEHGVDPHKDLKALLFAEGRTQPEVVKSVLEGKADVGVVRTDQLERMAKSGEIDLRYLRILNSHDTKGFPFFHSTRLYPEWAFASMPSVPPRLAQRVRQVLQAIPEYSDAANTGQYVDWVTALDYSPADKLMRRLKVGPYAYAKK